MTAPTPDSPPSATRPRTAPLSFAQQQLWVQHQLEAGSAAYHLPAAFRLEGMLDRGALERAVATLVDRHASLRTTFAHEGGRPVQVAAPSRPQPLAWAVIEATAAATPDEALRRQMADEIRRPFDLARGPLSRFICYRLHEQSHVLLIVIHHLVTDGWSTGILLRELCALYTAYTAGQPCALAPLPVSYGDYARRQHQQLSDGTLNRARAYWTQQLDGVPVALHLPTDRPRPPAPTSDGGHHWFTIPDATARALHTLSQREGATLFMALLAAFTVLLRRYGSQPDIVVGTPIAGRNQTDVEGLVGFFVNMLALRVQVDGQASFRALLRQVRGVALAAYDHQELPFAQVVEALQPLREPGQSPVFQVMFALQNAPKEAPSLPGLRVARMAVNNPSAKYDLTVMLQQGADGLHGYWEYKAALFDGATVGRIAAHYERLLARLLDAPDAPLDDLTLLSEAEQQQLLVHWNDTAAAYPSEQTIHGRFEAQAARTPDGIALIDGSATYTYDALNRRANRIAHTLLRQGLQPGTPVGVCLARTPAAIAAMLGVMKAGGAYLPLDPRHPEAHLAFLIRDSRLPILLTQTPHAARLPADAATVIALDALEAAPDAAPGDDANPGCDVAAGSPAYVIYTSGSTGQPKGVVGLHRGAINRFHWMWTAYPFQPGEVCCQKTALTFVDAVWEVFGPLLQGIPLVLLPDAMIRDPHQLIDALAAHGVTRLVLVPSLLRALLDAGRPLQPRLGRLMHWTCSGEALTPDLVRRFYEQLPHARLLNLYGSTEVSADATCYETRPSDQDAPIPIGRPISNTRVYVLDHRRRPVPLGVAGELYVGGDGLSDGYLHHPERTAQAFVSCRLGTRTERLYHTGDRGRYRPDGVLLFLGRQDHQVKIRGYRIELGAVEAALRQHPAVRQAVVVPQAEGDAPPQALAACVVPAAGAQVEAAALRHFLSARLPDYMIPSVFDLRAALPMTASGKIDRQALALPAAPPPRPAAGYTAPRTEAERRLVPLWEDVLGRRPISVTDDFFMLGGHSLRAVVLVRRIEEALGVRLPPATLFEAPTVAQLATHLQRPTPSGRHLVTIQAGAPGRAPLFCVHNLLGTVMLYGLLARQLGEAQPVYGLQSQDGTGGALPYTSVEAMAAAYVAEVRQVQPAGPYSLLGFCLGSRITLEMARQLQADGEEVALLALIDAPGPDLRGRRRRTWRQTLRVGRQQPRKVTLWQGVSARAGVRLRQWGYLMSWRLARSCLRLGRPIPAVLRDGYTLQAHRHLLNTYTVRPYNGTLLLLRRSGWQARGLPSDLGWKTYADVEERDVAGPHLRLLQAPYVNGVAQILNERLHPPNAYDR